MLAAAVALNYENNVRIAEPPLRIDFVPWAKSGHCRFFAPTEHSNMLIKLFLRSINMQSGFDLVSVHFTSFRSVEAG